MTQVNTSSIIIPITAQQFSVSQTRWSEQSDKRVKLLASMLSCFKAIKLSAYEVPCKLTMCQAEAGVADSCIVAQEYQKKRSNELKEMRIFQTKFAMNGLLYNCLFLIIRVALLASYALGCRHSSSLTFEYRPVCKSRSLALSL